MEPFFAPSLGLMVRVPVVVLKMPPPSPEPPAPPLPPLPPKRAAAGAAEPAVAAPAALSKAATSAVAAEAAGGLVIREVHGDPGKDRGPGVAQPAADSRAGRASGPALSADGEAAVAAGTKRAALAAACTEGDTAAAAEAAPAAVGLIVGEGARRRRFGWFLCLERDNAARCVEQAAAGADAAEPSTAAGPDVRGIGESAFPTVAEGQGARAARGTGGQSGQSAVTAQSAVGLVGRECDGWPCS